jgi:hypothetical protein
MSDRMIANVGAGMLAAGLLLVAIFADYLPRGQPPVYPSWGGVTGGVLGSIGLVLIIWASRNS